MNVRHGPRGIASRKYIKHQQTKLKIGITEKKVKNKHYNLFEMVSLKVTVYWSQPFDLYGKSVVSTTTATTYVIRVGHL